MKRNETHEDVAMTVPPITGVPVVGRGDGHCKRAGCGRPLPPGGRGRSREFCSDECWAAPATLEAFSCRHD
jgi:hypothetical protein